MWRSVIKTSEFMCIRRCLDNRIGIMKMFFCWISNGALLYFLTTTGRFFIDYRLHFSFYWLIFFFGLNGKLLLQIKFPTVVKWKSLPCGVFEDFECFHWFFCRVFCLYLSIDQMSAIAGLTWISSFVKISFIYCTLIDQATTILHEKRLSTKVKLIVKCLRSFSNGKT